LKTTAEKVEGKAVVKVCPVCGSEMEKGFYIVSHQTSWDIKKHKILGFLGEQITPPYMMTCKNFPAYRCRKCKIIVFKYGEANDSANENPP
jgi:hypothetical protein